MIRELRIYLALRPSIAELRKELKMKFSWNLVVQVLGTVIQGANAIGHLLPAQYQMPVALGVAAVQSIVAFVAHFTNPDGTPAEQPFISGK